jgi:hypothetical protein
VPALFAADDLDVALGQVERISEQPAAEGYLLAHVDDFGVHAEGSMN